METKVTLDLALASRLVAEARRDDRPIRRTGDSRYILAFGGPRDLADLVAAQLQAALLEIDRLGEEERRLASHAEHQARICREERDARQNLESEVARLVARQDELLELVARISQTTPLADEIAGWESQRARLIAEVGSLRAANAEAGRSIDRLGEELARARRDHAADMIAHLRRSRP